MSAASTPDEKKKKKSFFRRKSVEEDAVINEGPRHSMSSVYDLDELKVKKATGPGDDAYSPDKCLAAMRQGGMFLKWSENQKPQMYTLKIDAYNHLVQWRLAHKRLNEKSDKGSVEVSRIKEIRLGKPQKLRKLAEKYNIATDNLCFSIVHGSHLMDVNFINLVASSEHTFKLWVTGLGALSQVARKQLADPTMTWLKKQYLKLYDEKNDCFAMKNLINLFGKEKKADVKHAFELVGIQYSKSASYKPEEFPFERFSTIYNHVNKRTDIHNIFVQYTSGNRPYMTAQQFMMFLKGAQGAGVDLTEAHVAKIIQKFESTPSLLDQNYLSLDGFTKYLMSKENSVIKPLHRTVYQDMSQPMSHYFIASSHNTYLTGHQLRGESAVEMYIQVLQSGCRCVELDCWDGDDGEPIIYHGHTLTTKIKFEDVIRAIGKYAFESSPYPVILSFENHCSIPQQVKLAKYCQEH
eukprot:Opistho-1_new@97604